VTNELNRTFSKEEIQMAKKTHEKLLTIPGHKGNANQSHTKIPHSLLLELLSSRTPMWVVIHMYMEAMLGIFISN
jgi:hypothetical protein